MYEAIIISDLHFGSEICRAKKILSFLTLLKNKEIVTKELILNGDVFDSWDLSKMKKRHWKALALLQSLGEEIKIVFIPGNHDAVSVYSSSVVGKLLGASLVCSEYILSVGGHRVLVLHGDIFDSFLILHPIISEIADFLYGCLQKIDGSFRLCRWAKKKSKTFLHSVEKIEMGAKSEAIKMCANAVACGHSHLEADVDGEVRYLNSGSWTELPCTYLGILQDGTIELKHFDHHQK